MDFEAALLRYGRNLEDLTFNSKPLIDDLTRAAGQLEPKGDKVVGMIQKRIMKVRPEWKLPSLYLLDSIMKNLKGSYLERVGQVIVAVFCHCFEKLTEPDPRKMLYKLRTTWPPYLSKHKLATLDKHIRTLDPKWPITAVENDAPTPTIFVNRVFMKSQAPAAENSIEQRRKAVLQQTRTQRQEQERVMGLATATDKDKDRAENEGSGKKETTADNRNTPRARSSSPLPLLAPNSRVHKSVSPPRAHQATSKPNVEPPAKRIKVEDESKDHSEVIKKVHLQLDDIPPELLPVHQKKIRERIERQINAGNLTPEQRTTLVSQLNQLYELQKRKMDPNPPQPTPPNPPQPTPPNPSQPTPLNPPQPTPPNPPQPTPPNPPQPTPANPPQPTPPNPPQPTPPNPPQSTPLNPPQPTPLNPPQPTPPNPPQSTPLNPPQPTPPNQTSNPIPPPFSSEPVTHGQGNDFCSHPPPHYERARYRPYRTQHRPYRGRGQPEFYPPRPPWPGEHIPDVRPVVALPPPILPVGALIEKLQAEGFIQGGPAAVSSTRNEEVVPLKIPNLALTPATLKQRYKAVIDLLYAGTPCSSCGLRFLINSGKSYKSHLNWHYRINRQEKEDSKMSRNWFLHPDDWFKYEELTADGSTGEMKLSQIKARTDSPPETVASSESGSQPLMAEDAEPSLQSSSVEAGDANELTAKCMVCDEPFEQFWKEEEESWHFRDAIRDPSGKLCHTSCYKDAK